MHVYIPGNLPHAYDYLYHGCVLIPIRNERIWGRILSGVSAVYDLKAV